MRAFQTGILLLIGCLAFVATSTPVVAGTAESEFEALLIWGTNGKAPTNATLNPVDPKVKRKLDKMPFKWKQYYEVHRVPFKVQQGKSRKVSMSKVCDIVVLAKDSETIDLELIGEGKSVGHVSQKLPKGELLVVGGDAENYTSWFVVLRRVE